MTDTRELYRRAMTQTGSIIEAVRDDQLGLPTPCDEWDVRTLMSHITGVVTRVALLGEGHDILSVSPFTDLGNDRAGTYRAACDRAVAAWDDDAKLDALYAVPWGKAPGRAALGGYVRELLAHGWDLAVATGQRSELDPALGEFALDLSRQTVPAGSREGFPFGPAVSVPAGAGVYAQLAAWLGRTAPA